MIREVRTALQTRPSATVGQIAGAIGASEPDVEAAIAFWEHRGNVVRCVPAERVCGACRLCSAGDAPASYRWQALSQPRTSVV